MAWTGLNCPLNALPVLLQPGHGQCQIVRSTSDLGPFLLGCWITITALLMFTLGTATGHDGAAAAEITDKEPVNPFKSINQI